MILRPTLAGTLLLTLLPQQAFAQVVDTYEYDELGRLRVVDSDGTDNANDTTRSWCYDEQGNRVRYEAKGLGVKVPCADPPVQTPPATGGAPTEPPPSSANTPPVAHTDSVSGPQFLSMTVNLTANDNDAEDAPAKPVLVSITRKSGNSSATKVSASSVRVDFGPECQISEFDYQIIDSGGMTDTGSFYAFGQCEGGGFPEP